MFCLEEARNITVNLDDTNGKNGKNENMKAVAASAPTSREVGFEESFEGIHGITNEIFFITNT